MNRSSPVRERIHYMKPEMKAIEKKEHFQHISSVTHEKDWCRVGFITVDSQFYQH